MNTNSLKKLFSVPASGVMSRSFSFLRNDISKYSGLPSTRPNANADMAPLYPNASEMP